jgi:hypothetical protein
MRGNLGLPEPLLLVLRLAQKGAVMKPGQLSSNLLDNIFRPRYRSRAGKSSASRMPDDFGTSYIINLRNVCIKPGVVHNNFQLSFPPNLLIPDKISPAQRLKCSPRLLISAQDQNS